MAAEQEGLVTVDIHILKDPFTRLTQEFYNIYLNDSSSVLGKAWDKLREQIIVETLQHFLVPLCSRWIRDWLKEEEEEWVAIRCAAKLEEVNR